MARRKISPEGIEPGKSCRKCSRRRNRLLNYQGIWVAFIVLLVSQGKNRTYLTGADLVLVYPNRQEFKRLLT